jgi:hypothetical protein
MQLPLHAAGIYTGAEQISCSNFFVASYTPSIEALLNVQRTIKPIRRVDADTLLVAVHNPFEGSALPMTTEEAATIHQLVPSKIVQASRCTDVLDHIRSISILHLACHGSQNPADALQSGFTLDDSLLTVSKLMELDLPNAFLAVLSACETAKGDATQPDQAIHLAATMLFAGFKSIVATMWYVALVLSCQMLLIVHLQVHGRPGWTGDRREYLFVAVQQGRRNRVIEPGLSPVRSGRGRSEAA